MAHTRRAAVPQQRRLLVVAAATLASFAAPSAFVGSRPASPWASRASQPLPLTARAASDMYSVLGIEKDATVSEIKKAYYREAKNAHPDKHQGNEEMYKRFQAVAEAYSTLADPVRRQQYDLQGLAGLAHMNINATRLFGPPPWRVLIGKTNHWLWEAEKEESMLGLLVASIPNGIAGVTVKTLNEAYKRCMEKGVAVLLDRVSQNQAEDTVEALEEYGIAVKAEAIEGERTNEKESPLMYFRRIQRDLGEASEQLRMAALEINPAGADGDVDKELNELVDIVRGLRSELRAASKELEEFKEERKAAPKPQAAPAKAEEPKAKTEQPKASKAAAAPAKEEKKAAKAPAPAAKTDKKEKKKEKKSPKKSTGFGGDLKDLLLEKQR